MIRQFARYVLLGAVSFVLAIAITASLHEMLGVTAEFAYATAIACVLVWNFAAARTFVYQSSGPLQMEIFRYAVASIGFRLAEYGGFLLIHSVLGLHYLLSVVFIFATSFLSKFFAYGQLVFARKNGE